MKAKTKSQGFTIVETLIVLAVTSAMFLTAVVYISGRQSKAAFNDAIKDTQSRMQQVMTEVQAGVYPVNKDLSCRNAGSGPRLTTAKAEQGTNKDCVYLGKVLSFTPDGKKEVMRVDTLIGLRLDSTGKVNQSLGSSYTRVVNAASDASGMNQSHIDIGVNSQLKSGLDLQSMCAYDTAAGTTCTPIAGMAIVTDPSSQIGYGSDGLLKSGSITASVVGIPKDTASPGSPGVTRSEMYDLIKRSIGSSMATPPLSTTFNPSKGILFCFASGTTDQSGLVTVGSGARGLTTDLKILTGKTCGL